MNKEFNIDNVMQTLNFKQLQSESEGWKKLLDQMMDENIHLKNKVAEILQYDFNKDNLEGIEHFQNSFIKQDALIVLLRNEMTEVDKLLTAEATSPAPGMSRISSKLDNLRSNIAYAERYLHHLRSSFDSYILGLLGY